MAPSFYTEVIQPLINEEDSQKVIKHFQQKQLLANEMKCSHCHKNLNWTKHTRCTDKYIWRCRNKACEKFSTKMSIRKKSFFENSNLSLKQWVHAMYLWCNRIGEKRTLDMVGVNERTMIDMYNFFREICTQYFVRNPVRLGGSGHCVEIDESCFGHKVKHHRGRGPL